MAPADCQKECLYDLPPTQNDQESTCKVESPKGEGLTSAPLLAWNLASSNRTFIRNQDQLYWWSSCGHALAVLLHAARYEQKDQVATLDFFLDLIIPYLGPAPSSNIRWESFMTDDHAPIELSWEWNPSKASPVIRFSVEPVTIGAGSASDPNNCTAAACFRESMAKAFPLMNMEWFDHFDDRMSHFSTSPGPERHSPQVFWAFDCEARDPKAKAYFFPALAARALGQSKVDILSTAIASAPHCSPEKLNAWEAFRRYVGVAKALDVFMLSVDLLDPHQSRIKIYFRDRRTSFSSVVENMTLGGQVADRDTDLGLKRLRKLWGALFEQRNASDTTPLRYNHHKTAGILYLTEFRLGDRLPKTKIYLPVRHYASNDFQVMKVLHDSVQNDDNSLKASKANRDYVEAMMTIL